MKPKCCYCGGETLEKKESYTVKHELRLVRVNVKLQIIFYCYRCKRFCLMMKDDYKKTDSDEEPDSRVLTSYQEIERRDNVRNSQ